MEIRQNKAKAKLKSGGIAMICGGITSPDDIDTVGSVLVQTGFDGIWLEGEHGSVTDAELGDLTRACDIWGLSSVARINRNDQALIYRTLDRGAQGIVVPHVDTREEAENIVAGGKFPPIGRRGMFISRQGYGVQDYFLKANDETILVALVEDIKAVNNLDEILKVEHIDVFFVAPSDLAASMGLIGQPGSDKVRSTIEETVKRIAAAGRVPGMLVNNETAEHAVKIGARFLFTTVGGWLKHGAEEMAERVQKARDA